jgi:gamma-glutamylcyclotransferase (GGCT)/AIG2-like uncharacterized protein YtfP
MDTPTALLFSYGTLQKKEVQRASFGRELAGRRDALPGYVRRLIPIADPAAAAAGDTHYANAEPSPDPHAEVAGMVFEIMPQELAAADLYEAPAGYERILVTLRSGARAWVYVHRES